jgi:hypothetical protein
MSNQNFDPKPEKKTTPDLKSTDMQIEDLEKLLNQSIRGYHHLFPKDRIANIMKTPTEELDFFTTQNMETIQKLFNDLMKKDSYHEKMAYIDRLNEKNFEILLRTYFHIVDSTILTQDVQRH